MTKTTGSTRWRDAPVVPSDYSIAALVASARRARNRVVEFEWVLMREDLERLRRAVYEWGKQVVGRFKTFDARMLKAMNQALDDHTSVLVLNEPPTLDRLDYSVRCTRDGELFRLNGHASFCVIFAYGAAGASEDAELMARLGPTLRDMLATAVSMLGWDVRRLQALELRPVINAIYGNALNFGIEERHFERRDLSSADTLTVEFRGPFAATSCKRRRCLFADEAATGNGVYLLTIRVEDENWVWYVGQTRVGFRTRMAQHVTGFLSGQYASYDPDALSRGENRLAAGSITPRWPNTLPAFLTEHGRLMPKVAELIDRIDFHFAPLDVKPHVLSRIEGGIGRHFKKHPNERLRNFLMPGFKVPAAIPFDEPLLLAISSETPIAELPPTLPL